jgi:chitodextrinase
MGSPAAHLLVIGTIVGGAALAGPVTSADAATRDHEPPARVRAVKATPSETSVKLRWTNPGAKDLAGVVIKRRAGTIAPKTPRAGKLVGKVKKPKHALVDRGLTASSTYSYAIFAYDGHHNFSRRAVTTTTTRADKTPPGPVSALSAESTDSTIQLTWTNPTAPDFSGVVVRRSLGATPPASPTSGVGVPVAGTADTILEVDLDSNQTYAYSVFALDAVGNVSSRATIVVTTKVDVIPPDGAIIQDVTRQDHSLQLHWTIAHDSDVDAVWVVRKAGTEAPVSLEDGDAVKLPGAPKTYTDEKLPAQSMFSYTVITQDRAGNLSPVTLQSTVTRMTLDDTSAPAPVKNAGAFPLDRSVDLIWTDPDEDFLDHIVIVRKTGETAPGNPTDGETVAEVAPATQQYRDLDLQPFTRYSYSFFAVDTDGNVSGPRSASTITGADSSAPQTVAQLEANAGLSDVRLTWIVPNDPDVAGIEIRRGSPASPQSPHDGTLVATLEPNAVTYHDTGLLSGTTYGYSVFRFDASGNYSESNIVSATTDPDDIAPGPVEGLQAGGAAASINLFWRLPADPDLKEVMIRLVPSGLTNPQPNDGTLVARLGLETSYHHPTPPNTSRTYAVFAFDSSGNASVAATATAQTPRDNVAPGPITNLIGIGAPGNVSFNWTNPTQPPSEFPDLEYVLVRRVTGTNPPGFSEGTGFLVDIQGGANSFVDDTGVPGQVYAYSFFVVDTSDNHSAANSLVIGD